LVHALDRLVNMIKLHWPGLYQAREVTEPQQHCSVNSG
jgi:hypothetical protein